MNSLMFSGRFENNLPIGSDESFKSDEVDPMHLTAIGTSDEVDPMQF